MKVPISQVFDNEEAIKPVLEFLADTDMEKVIGIREKEVDTEAEEGGNSSEGE